MAIIYRSSDNVVEFLRVDFRLLCSRSNVTIISFVVRTLFYRSRYAFYLFSPTPLVSPYAILHIFALRNRIRVCISKIRPIRRVVLTYIMKMFANTRYVPDYLLSNKLRYSLRRCIQLLFPLTRLQACSNFPC